MKTTSEEMIGLSTAAALATAIVLSVIGAVLAAFGHDEVIRFHGLLLAAAAIAAGTYVVHRGARARIAGYWAPWFVVWGYQLFIVLAASGYVLGVTQSREYAEPEWYVDVWLTLVWVVYLLVFLGTLWKRKEPHIYVAN